MLAAGDNFIPDGKLRSVAKVRYLIHTNKKCEKSLPNARLS